MKSTKIEKSKKIVWINCPYCGRGFDNTKSKGKHVQSKHPKFRKKMEVPVWDRISFLLNKEEDKNDVFIKKRNKRRAY